MRWSLVLLCVLLLVAISEGRSKKKKPGKKPSKPGKKGECDPVNKIDAKNFNDKKNGWRKYTGNGKCTCWWDITKHDCACCKNKGVQCGFPMHKKCYKKSAKGYGCPGVCNYKYTLSGKGYPCYSDHEDMNCAWCNKLGYQCKQDSFTGPKSNKGSRCQARTNQNYCVSQQGDCKHIGYCDSNATCKLKAKIGKYAQFWQCECNRGFSGNGILCRDGNGTLSAKPNQQVEVTMTMTAGLYEDTPVENEFNHGAAMESLLSEMESAGSSCSGDDCEASYEVIEV